jgi:hypothetical protein
MTSQSPGVEVIEIVNEHKSMAWGGDEESISDFGGEESAVLSSP